MVAKPTILITALPDFDRRYKYHKQMRGGIGSRSLRKRNQRSAPRNIHPILDVLCGAAVLREAGFDVCVDDDQYRDSIDYAGYERALRARLSGDPDIVFVRLSQPSLVTDFSVSKKLRALWPAAIFHAFGPLFSAQELINCAAETRIYDTLIASEFESVVLRVAGGERFEEIPGIYVRSDDGYDCTDPKRALADMQSLPFAAYDLVDYRKLDRFIVQTERGCPLACNYCPYYLGQGHKFRAKTPERVVEELCHYFNIYGIQRFLIHDPIFSLDRKRVVAICEGLIDAALPIEWECETHMDHLDAELLRLLYQAGNRHLAFGVESASDDVLNKANRRFNKWDTVKENVRLCKELGIRVTGYFILALPGETLRSAFQTMRLARELDLDVSRFNLPSSYPGTGAFDLAVQSQLLQPEDFRGTNVEYYTQLVTEGVSARAKGHRISYSDAISDRQALLLWYIARHRFVARGNTISRFLSRLKVGIYLAIVGASAAFKLRRMVIS